MRTPSATLLTAALLRVIASGEALPAGDSLSRGDSSAIDLRSVTVTGKKSQADRLRRSALPVLVVETEKARRQSADLGEVMARTQGVSVRRDGGLGSKSRFSLNGLTDDQIRFFLDGLPLDFSGFPGGIAQVPVNWIDHAAVYRGVVPIALGADALGGAVNLVSRRDFRDHGAFLSLQKGSFGTDVMALGLQKKWTSGFFLRAHGFFETSDNDYPVAVEVTDARGKRAAAELPRFHDGYLAYGNGLEAGFTHRPWARLFSIKGFVSRNEKEVPHSLDMQRPYGEVAYGGTHAGLQLKYRHFLFPKLEVDVVGGLSRDSSAFADTSHCAYNWRGDCVTQRAFAGEITGTPRDQYIATDAAFGRFNLAWFVGEAHTLRLTHAPTFTHRSGRNSLVSDAANDPLAHRRDMGTAVTGIEHQYLSPAAAVDQVIFLKHYLQDIRAVQPAGGAGLRDQSRTTSLWGVGNAFRLRVADPLHLKASYEYAIRQPRPTEVFGDGKLILENLALVPERSHNANVGLQVAVPTQTWGKAEAEINGFLRLPHQLIHPMGRMDVVYQNIYDARSAGAEAALSWEAADGKWQWNANASYLDYRNASRSGPFAFYAGDRIPNRPFLFANGGMEYVLPFATPAWREIRFFSHHRYVHAFYRTWESLGAADQKQTIPAQFTHGAGITAFFRPGILKIWATAEIQNLTDGRRFDFYGVQRPGRAYSVKLNAEL